MTVLATAEEGLMAAGRRGVRRGGGALLSAAGPGGGGGASADPVAPASRFSARAVVSRVSGGLPFLVSRSQWAALS